MPVFASDEGGNRRHSLILRPSSEQTGAIPLGTTTEQPPVGRSVASPAAAIATPSTTGTPTLHRKLTKRPGQDTGSVSSTAQHQPSQTVQQAASAVQSAPVGAAVPALAGATTTPQATMPNRTTVPLPGISSTKSAAASTPPSSTLTPLASTASAQPLAAAGSGPSSRVGGSRAALNLFNNQALVNLLQAPPPPLVTPPSNPPSTPPSSPPSTPPPPPAPTTGSATLSWNLGTETDLAGYKIYVGTSSGNYNYPGSPFTVGRVTSYTITNLPAGQTYHFALSAYDNAGNSSPLSSEVTKSIY